MNEDTSIFSAGRAPMPYLSQRNLIVYVGLLIVFLGVCLGGYFSDAPAAEKKAGMNRILGSCTGVVMGWTIAFSLQKLFSRNRRIKLWSTRIVEHGPKHEKEWRLDRVRLLEARRAPLFGLHCVRVHYANGAMARFYHYDDLEGLYQSLDTVLPNDIERKESDDKVLWALACLLLLFSIPFGFLTF
jgi:hypothetical protein